jgi:hypothetical protein
MTFVAAAVVSALAAVLFGIAAVRGISGSRAAL